MYVEKRHFGKNTKYYLVYSYREKEKVKKIRIYLGLNLSKEMLKTKREKAKKLMLKIVEEMNTKVFSFTLTKKQRELLNKYNEKIKIFHLTKKEWQIFTENFVYNTNALEGSTISKEEVKEVLSKKPKAKDSDKIEALGVAKAINYIRSTKKELSLEFLLKLHKLCFDGSKSFAGKFREVNVIIRNSKGDIIHAGVPKGELMDYLKDFILWYKENKSHFKPLVLAAILHNQFEYIHPFQDGNGRVGRLLLNYILVKNNYPPINIKFKDRKEYYQTLQKYSKEDDLKPTLKFLIKQYNKTLEKVPTKDKK